MAIKCVELFLRNELSAIAQSSNIDIAVCNAHCASEKKSKEKESNAFTCEFLERHNSKLTSLLSSSVRLLA